MNIGTMVSGELIVDERHIKNTNLETAISAQRSSLRTAIHNEGLELYELGEERKLTFNDETKQIRQIFRLVLTKNLSKKQIYSIIDLPLEFN